MALIDINLRPSERELRWFGALLWVFFALLAALIYWRAGTRTLPSILAATGTAICFVYYALRPLRRPLFVAWMLAVYPLGWTIAHLLFAMVYFLVVTPIGALLRVFGYDPLARGTKNDGASSFWAQRSGTDDPKRYFRQF